MMLEELAFSADLWLGVLYSHEQQLQVAPEYASLLFYADFLEACFPQIRSCFTEDYAVGKSL